MKLILLFDDPAALVTVSLPSVTCTSAVPSTQGFAELGVPLVTVNPSAAMPKTLSKTVGSPETMRTV